MHIELIIFVLVCVVWIIILVSIGYCCLLWCRTKQPYDELAISNNAATSSTCKVHGEKTTSIPIHEECYETETEESSSRERAKEMANAATYQEIPFVTTVLTNFHV